MDNRQPVLRSDNENPPDELTFADIVVFFRRHWGLIFGLALAAGLVTALVVLVFVPRSYEASATLVVVPPKFSSELRPATLTVQGYQQILESGAVIAEAKKRLEAKGVLAPNDYLRLGREIDTRIFASRRAEETVLTPMIEAVARGRSPQQASAIANEWAGALLERAREVMAGSTSDSVQLIDRQYPEARAALEKLEQQRAETQDAFQKRYDDAVTAWDAKITVYKNETTDLLATYRAESARFLGTYSAEKDLETRKVRLDALRKAYSDLQEEQARVSSLLDQQKLQLEAVRKQLAAAPQYLEVRKAISDDALWQALANGGGKTVNWSELQKRSLVSQQLNPIYQVLATRMSTIETDVFALGPRAEQLKNAIERLSSEVQRLEQEYGGDTIGLEKLKQERAAGLETLQENRGNGLAVLARDKHSELEGISRERDARLAQFTRDISHQQDLFSNLAKVSNQAMLAKAQQDSEDIRLVSPAVPPDTPKARGLTSKALLATLLGGILGLGVALVQQALASPPGGPRAGV
jgi:uncharacterized protein involved in exopolysaccharide biosynthesis